MGKSERARIEYWFENSETQIAAKACVENELIPGVIFYGSSLDQALSRMVAFMSIDVMGEYPTLQEKGNEEEQVQIEAGENGGPDF